MSRRSLIPLAVIALGLAGCGGATKTVTMPPSSTSATSGGGNCTTELTDAPVTMTIYGRGGAGCNEWNGDRAKQAHEYWRTTIKAPNGRPLCTLTHNEGIAIQVREGSSTIGDAICAKFIARGLREVKFPGGETERVAWEHEQAAKR
jgi:hypothetical protein